MGSIENTVDPAVILQPNDLPAVPSILSELQALGASLDPNDDQTRQSLLASARSLIVALEKPRETMIRHCWAENALSSVISLGVEAGIWDYLASTPAPKTVEQIAAATRTEAGFIGRLLKHVAAMGYIREVAQDTYASTSFSDALTIPILNAGYRVFTGPGNTGGLQKCVSTLPSYARQTGYRTPTSMLDGNLQFAHGTKLNMFEWLMANPPAGECFNLHMSGYAHGRPRWVDPGFYPVKERLLDGYVSGGSSSALLVDVGGGLGHDISNFLAKHPECKGRLVLQDLEPVISQISALDARIEPTVHDFHAEQPVKGARAYYMHSVLHDWPDEVCLSILGQIKKAMKPGYSRLLINENVIPDTKAHWETTGLDILMSLLLSSKERTRMEWSRLLEEQAGFKITGIYGGLSGVESLIECVVPE
ncbi:S-adenosyl-L-methionine-dependent methyltransferase [Cladorrhinum samala]|uniref:S-adenosyl-L-methionine-dependent methyltransferase n=1 Tax=Cladorrhinum samala TaxID=585594 RepID=A0AAV9H967_9PEZI|nr:S-adenosyl-L-methionine-dependent methyltransferase [Cladorrhinum samala]